MSRCIIQQKAQQNIIALTNSPCVDGPLVEKLNISELKEVTIDTYSKNEMISREERLSMPEFPAQKKKKILNDKLNSCENAFQITKLLETLEEEQTSNEKDFKPFWNESAKEKLILLPSIPRIGLPDLEANSLSSSVISSIPQSFMWKEKRTEKMKPKTYLKTYLPSSHTLQPNTMEAESMERRATRKIRIYPSDDLKKHLEYYFGATRYVYNNAIEFINKRSKEHYEAKQKGEKSKLGLSKSTVRDQSVIKNADINEDSSDEWLLNVQYLTRIDASDEALKNFSTAIKNISKGNIKHFDMKYRSKKKPKQTCYLSHKALNLREKYFFGNLHHKGLAKRIEKGKKDMSFKVKRKGKKEYNKYFALNNPHDLKLCVDNDHYYLHVSIDNPSPILSANNMKEVVSLDPGVRTFQTGYSPSNRYYKIGDGFTEDLHKKYLNKMDRLQSELAENPNKKLQSILNSLRTKVRNRVDDLHKQTAAFLLKRYNTIIVGDFNDKGNAVRRKKRQIGRKTVRGINLLGHCRFRDYLSYRASLVNDRQVIVMNEAFTSKTCGACGFIHKELGASKIYNCPKCSYKADRDIHGARNILLKGISAKSTGQGLPACKSLTK